MQISLPDPNVEEVVREILGTTSNTGLVGKLEDFALLADGPRQITHATVAVASAMLLAKTAMPHEQTKFAASVDSQMALIRPYPALVELAFALLAEEAATVGDVFRDRRLITDTLFQERLAAIKQSLRH